MLGWTMSETSSKGSRTQLKLLSEVLRAKTLARGVVTDLRRRLDAAIVEIVERTNEMTVRIARLQR